MDLQTVFYTIGIVFMSLMIVMMIAFIVLLFYIKNKLTAIHDMITEKLQLVSQVVSHPGDVAAGVSTAVARSAYKKVKQLVDKK